MSTSSNVRSTTGIGLSVKWQIVLCYIFSAVIAYTFLKYMHVKFYPDPNKAVIFRDIEAWAGYDWINPYFRFLTGGVEAVAAVILFVPGLQIVGAIISLVTMIVAMYLHLLGPIGIEGGRGWLALENLMVQVFSLWIIYVRRHEFMDMMRYMFIDRTWARQEIEFFDR